MIEIGSKWRLEKGNVYEVIDKATYYHLISGINFVTCVWYKDDEGELYVIKEDHFLKAFTKLEPVHEAKYAFIFDGELNVTPMYLTKDEAKQAGYTEDQRIKISTRERQS